MELPASLRMVRAMTELFDQLLREAEQRHSGQSGRGRLTLYESFLRVHQRRLMMRHRAGGGGLAIAGARTELIDAVLRHLFVAARTAYATRHPRETLPAVALVAVGGYGRAELNPFSDIDILLLHAARGQAGETFLKSLYNHAVLPLFDLSLRVGYTARSVKQCIEQANKDMETKTSLIEARLIVGDLPLFDAMQEKLLAQCVRPCVSEYIEQRMHDQAERHAKFGDTVFLQEPHVKNGCGGLRDLQNLFWMSLFKHGVRTLPELEERKFLTRAERRTLAAAYEFLVRVRTELHYEAGRASDELTLALQLPVATRLGYDEPNVLKRIEHFMHDYYSHTREVFQLTNALALRMALKPPGFFERRGIHLPILRLGAKMEKQDGFVIRGDLIEPESPEVFREDPLRLIRVFRLAQQRQAFLSPELQTMIREQLRLVDNRFRSHPRARETFLAILGEGGGVGRIARMMHEVGFLGKYLPEFGRLDALVQHEFFHRYTADEHTLVTLQRLDAVVAAKEGPELDYKPLFHEVTRPELLYFALLLHDAGKAANEAEHSAAGVRLAERAARRIGLDDAGRETLAFLIRHHLAMYGVTQRRDLDDPDAIAEFARLVANLPQLNNLLLLTYADMTGTSAELWNDWRNSLLWDLYLKTRAELVAGAESQALQEQRLQTMLKHIRERSAMPKEEVAAHFEKMQRRYFLTFTAEEILRHLEIIHAFLQRAVSASRDSLMPQVLWTDKPDRGYSQVTVCTWDREGLFSKICGSFSFAGVNILNAHAYSRRDGIVLDVFNVAGVEGGIVSDREQRHQFERTLDRALDHGADLDQLLAKHRPHRSTARVPQGVVPTEVRMDITASRTRTVVEVQAEDRLGLLYTIAETLARHGLDINLARISTEKGAAFDTFYVVTPDGEKVTDAARLERARTDLVRAIEHLRRRPIA
ncbi:MAG: [protein-PII] uridylyltransferase [Verrucomicrobiia bacterium]